MVSDKLKNGNFELCSRESPRSEWYWWWWWGNTCTCTQQRGHKRALHTARIWAIRLMVVRSMGLAMGGAEVMISLGKEVRDGGKGLVIFRRDGPPGFGGWFWRMKHVPGQSRAGQCGGMWGARVWAPGPGLIPAPFVSENRVDIRSPRHCLSLLPAKLSVRWVGVASLWTA